MRARSEFGLRNHNGRTSSERRGAIPLVPTVSEALGTQSQMQAALDAGVDSISVQQNVIFTRYSKFVLAPDSSVFWIATPQTLNVTGALHYATDRGQHEDETVATNTVFLTAEIEVTQFNAVSPGTMWVGTWPVGDGLTIQVVFGQRGGFFGPAELWHYSGVAVLPAMSTQLIADASDLPTGPIVSNSLPIWLSMNQMAPVFPSFAVPDNIAPPYIVAHVDPAGTQAFQAFPNLTWPGTTVPDSGASPLYQLSSNQLCRDEVDLTLYGFTAQMAGRYYWSLIEASLYPGNFGFANSPVISDAKRVQVEIAALAQKKTLHISANYYQSTANAIARRLILEAWVSSITTPGGVGAEGQVAVVQDGQGVNASGLVIE